MLHESVVMTLDSALDQAMRENMLDEVYRGFVMLYLARQDDNWRQCCDSACEPCVLQVGRVVDRVRQLLADET